MIRYHDSNLHEYSPIFINDLERRDGLIPYLVEKKIQKILDSFLKASILAFVKGAVSVLRKTLIEDNTT